MSLVIVRWDADRFAAVCSDGLAVVEGKNRQPVRIGENHRKFYVVSDDLILVGTGLMSVSHTLEYEVRKFVQEHRADLNLFNQLAEMIPVRLRELFQSLNVHIGLGAETFAAIGLVGYDAAQQKIRALLWNVPPNFDPQESADPRSAMVLGRPEAVPVAKALIEHFLEVTPEPTLDSVTPTLEYIVTRASEASPMFVNDNVVSHLLLHPKMRLNEEQSVL